MSWLDNAEQPLSPLTFEQIISSIRDSLIKKTGRNYSLRISGCETEIYGCKTDAVDRLEEVLGLRPMIFDFRACGKTASPQLD